MLRLSSSASHSLQCSLVGTWNGGMLGFVLSSWRGLLEAVCVHFGSGGCRCIVVVMCSFGGV